MTRALFVLLVCACMATACSTQRMVCPAYQSTFYFDKKKQKEAFVFTNDNKNQPREILASNSKTLNLPPNDSSWENSHVIKGPALPFERKQKKEKYLLLPKKTYKQALRQLQTVPMKPVYPKIEEDSTDIKKLLDSAARSVTDTITAASLDSTKSKTQPEEDSVYVITKEKEKFNLDQDNYMWYFRDILVLPDVKQGMEASQSDSEARGTTATKTKEGFFSKLKNLFKKKGKHKKDTSEVKPVTPPEENYDTEPDSTAVQSQQPETVSVDQPAVEEKKSGLLRKKKKSKTAPAPPVKKSEAKKDEKDGF